VYLYCGGVELNAYHQILRLCLTVGLFPSTSIIVYAFLDRLCGLVVRVPFYRFRGPGFDSSSLPDFLRSSESGMGSTQPHQYN
jgi:hypothetical protein